MIAVATLWSLLAQVERPITKDDWYQSIHHRFLFGEPDAYKGIFTSLLVIALIIGLSYILYRWQKRRQQPAPAQPMGLYRRVLAKLGLSFFERWLLRRLAKAYAIEHPTALLISARLYDRAVEQYCARAGFLLAHIGKATTFAMIRRRLFGEKR